jgi:hypothetical protein
MNLLFNCTNSKFKSRTLALCSFCKRMKFIGKLGIGVAGVAFVSALLPGQEPVQPANPAGLKEYHVSVTGMDSNQGTMLKPFKSISRAAEAAQSGDTITVHQGIYRERIIPPRGGKSNEERIVYRAIDGDEVVIKGSEVVKGWEHLQTDTWQVTIPNSFFGDLNPYPGPLNEQKEGEQLIRVWPKKKN